jgi:hypothetical protein
LTEFTFDPARSQRMLELALEAAKRAKRRRGRTAPELGAAGLALANQPLEAVGERAVLELAGDAIRTADATGAQIERFIARRERERHYGAAVSSALPTFPWSELAEDSKPFMRAQFLMSAATLAIEAITVTWPPKGAAAVWNPARPETVEAVEALVAHALSGPHHMDPGELLEGSRALADAGLERLPEDAYGDALAAIFTRDINGEAFAVDRVIRELVELGQLAWGNDEVLRVATAKAARGLDASGLLGGARFSAEALVDEVAVRLAGFPGPLGRFLRSVDTDGSGLRLETEEALSSALLARRLLE